MCAAVSPQPRIARCARFGRGTRAPMVADARPGVEREAADLWGRPDLGSNTAFSGFPGVHEDARVARGSGHDVPALDREAHALFGDERHAVAFPLDDPACE